MSIATEETRKNETKQMENLLKTFRSTYMYDCYEGKSPEACYNLADVIYSVDRDYKKAFEMYDKLCREHKHGHSCYKYGLMLMKGAEGIPKDEDGAIDALKFACENTSNPQACYDHALMARIGTDKRHAPNQQLAFQSLKRACALNHGRACLLVAQGYLNGSIGSPEVDQFKALDYARTSCRLLEWRGCDLAAMMLTKGLGCAIDEQGSRKYATLAEEIRKQLGITHRKSRT